MSWVSISPSRKESQSVTSTNLWSKVPKEWGLCCCCLVAQSCLIFATPWIAACQASLSFTILQSLFKLKSIESVIPSSHFILCLQLFSSWSQSFPASGFPISWLFPSGGQSIRASTSASVLPMNTQSWFPLGLTGLISLLSKGLSSIFSSTTIQKH